MTKLVLWLAIGLVTIIVGGILLVYSSYYSNLEYSGNQNCYGLYPPVINATTSQYTYTSAYYTCENNITAFQNRYRLYSNVLAVPGWTLALFGAVAIISATALLAIAAYKDRARPKGAR